MKRLLLVLLPILLAAGFAAGLPQDAQAKSNAAVAINTKDDSSLFKFAWSIKKVAGGVVDHTNLAVAYSKCQRCRTVAIAVQIVLVTAPPSQVTPTNVAVAVNENCTLCETFASAHQFVISTGGPVKFTKAGKAELKRIKQELRQLGRSKLPLAELRRRISLLMTDLKRVLATQLVPARGDDDDDDGDGDDDEEDEEGEDSSEHEGDGSEQPPAAEEGDATTTEPGTASTTPTSTVTDTFPTTTESTTTTTTTTPTTTTP